MSKNCPIMQRMKSNYEDRYRFQLTRRTPVIIRIDGKAFHTYTKGLNKPFDENLIEDMQKTTEFLCKNIQGAKLGYTQSDEISILLVDYDTLTTDGWFDYNVQKIVSVSASITTAIFNRLRVLRGKDNLAYFDSRVFNIPVDEVSNYFLARQKDAVRNSISMLAQSLYSHKQLENKNMSDMQEMCFQKGYNWNNLEYYKKRGSTIIKQESIWSLVETPENFNNEYFNNLIRYE